MAIQAVCASSKEERILPLLSPTSRARQSHTPRVDAIPRLYAEMDGEELDRRITAARAQLGERLVILGHHYQRDEIIKYADYRGDSFKLAQNAAARPEADYILMLKSAELVIAAALERRESRGSHWRSDYQRQDERLAQTHYVFCRSAEDAGFLPQLQEVAPYV